MSTNSGNISYEPTAGLSYDPSEEKYWDEAGLAAEVTRTFEICHGCRMCFKYCDSFPDLFSFIDERHDGDVGKLEAKEVQQVMDGCFQCKLCEVQCPYTVRDGHAFQLDFPKLVHRFRAQRRRKDGGRLRETLLADPDRSAKLARASLGLANVMNRNGLHRWFMDKVLGIHRDANLPEFASRTFEAWAEREGRTSPRPGEAEVVLFQTCYVQNNEPAVGQDACKVLDRNSVRSACVKGLGCCGMPAWEKGDLESLRARAKRNLDLLEPWVDAGAKVAVINPTCSMMMRREYPELLEGRDRDRARALAEATVDVSEFLWSIRGEERFDTDFASTPGDTVAYHAPCHLRAQSVGFKGRDLIKKIPGVKTTMTMECCGHDGTYAMTVEGYEPAKRIGGKAFGEMKSAEAEVWATDCPLAALQFEQHAGTKPMHPLSILARAYEPDGFLNRIEREPRGGAQ